MDTHGQTYYRASSLAGYSVCARRAVATQQEVNVERQEVRYSGTSWSAIAGMATHECFAMVPGRERDQAAEGCIQAEYARCARSRRPIAPTKVAPDFEACVELVKRNLRSFDAFAPLAEMRARIEDGTAYCEYKMSGSFELPNGRRMAVSGRLDLYDPEQRLLVDIKCTANRKAPAPLEQFGQYIHMLDAPVERVEVWWLVFDRVQASVPVEVIKYDPAACVATLSSTLSLVDWANRRYELTQDLNDVPGNYGSFACNANWCVLYGTPHCRQYEHAADPSITTGENDG